jgi:stalled ribosome alternative rescue factor ArfA
MDQNSDRIAAPSFAPFFAALLKTQPSYSLLPISLVTDHNCLRKLFDFTSGHRGENWRIEVALVKETLFLTRREKSQVGIITGSFNSDYGHEFEHAFPKTEEGLEDSCAHHRVA